MRVVWIAMRDRSARGKRQRQASSPAAVQRHASHAGPDGKIMTGMTHSESRRAQVLQVLRQSAVPLDDDEIAAAVVMNRVYVNTICWRLAEEGLITRGRGAAGRLVSSATEGQSDLPSLYVSRQSHRHGGGPKRTERVARLIAGFAGYVEVFEAGQAFPGPSLYFHLRAIERRRKHQEPGSLLADTRFLEYVYAVLPAWGMHRMGPQAAKVADFDPIVTALRESAPALEQLWPLRITTLTGQAAHDVAIMAWDVIANIKVSLSQTQIVAGSKFLHHVLPDLIPPIDRQYTFTFFTGQKTVPSDQAAFLEWFPILARIGAESQSSIKNAIDRGGFMATGEAKVIDNAIMGFAQSRLVS
jgi:hypothetical protein